MGEAHQKNQANVLQHLLQDILIEGLQELRKGALSQLSESNTGLAKVGIGELEMSRQP